MAREVVYATNNPGKLWEVGQFLQRFGITLQSPRDMGVSIDVEETGSTLEENALLKVEALHQLLPDSIIISDDTGVEIDALNGAPGIYVRRWKDHKNEMTDEEIVAHCMQLMQGVSAEARGAQFRSVVAVAHKSLPESVVFSGTLRGSIALEPGPHTIEGFPFEAIFYIPEWDLMLWEAHEKAAQGETGYLTHRERAVEKAVPLLQELMEQS